MSSYGQGTELDTSDDLRVKSHSSLYSNEESHTMDEVKGHQRAVVKDRAKVHELEEQILRIKSQYEAQRDCLF